MTAIACFDDFNPHSDPHVERDFGNVEFQGSTCYELALLHSELGSPAYAAIDPKKGIEPLF